jgi:hypothetical protein
MEVAATVVVTREAPPATTAGAEGADRVLRQAIAIRAARPGRDFPKTCRSHDCSGSLTAIFHTCTRASMGLGRLFR